MAKQHLKIGTKRFSLPSSPIVRIGIGILLVLGGLVGFLPILGFWMVPLGLVVLSVDIPAVRRFRRRVEVKWGHWRRERRAEKARRERESAQVVASAQPAPATRRKSAKSQAKKPGSKSAG